MWKLSEISPNTEYVIQLCHDASGVRTLRLRAPSVQQAHPDAIFETEVVPHEILKQRNFFRIAEEVRLVGGGKFEFDAHGIWFTPEELDALDALDDEESEGEEVPWCSKTPPALPPR